MRGSIDAGNDPIDVKAILAQMLQMGDEGHNRNRAGSLMALRELSPSIVAVDAPSSDIAAVLKFIGGNEHFYLNLGMPTAKLAMDAARDIPGSSMVTVMARNGTEFGIQTAGTGDRWFTGPAQTPVGLYLGDYGPEDANPDIGDSAIMETYGVGGFSMAAAPAIVRFVGGTVPDALATTERMYQLTLAENPAMAIPIMGFRGSPTGIDVLKVARTGWLPQINTGMAGPGRRHRSGRRRPGAAAAGVLREGAGRARGGVPHRLSSPVSRRRACRSSAKRRSAAVSFCSSSRLTPGASSRTRNPSGDDVQHGEVGVDAVDHARPRSADRCTRVISFGRPSRVVCVVITSTRFAPTARSIAPPTAGGIAASSVAQFARSPAAETWKAPRTVTSMWPPRIIMNASVWWK